MRRLPKLLIVGAAAVVTAIVGFALLRTIVPSSTVCSGTPTSGYCDTHVSQWAIVGLVAGFAIGGAVAWALLVRSGRITAS